MDGKTIKIFIASFTAGALLTGSYFLGKNSSHLDAKTATTVPKTVTTSTPDPNASKASLIDQKGSSIIANLVETAGPAVVKIEIVSQNHEDPSSNGPFNRHFFGGGVPLPPGHQQQADDLGSGFIISKDGYILTNNHVVENPKSIKVTVSGQDEPFDATVIGNDPELDLAVIKINSNKDLPTLKLGNSDNIRVGDWAVAIGNPWGLDHTVTVGVISAKGRPLDIGEARFKDLLQTDASINPGNSGGPLFNLNGEVIGINSAINAQAQGIGFAIPINTVQGVLDQLINKGKVARPWLGVSIEDLTPEIQKYANTDLKEGTLVDAVVPGSPAEQAGIEPGDIITQMDKTPIKDSKQLSSTVANMKIGEKHEVQINRHGEVKTITATIGEKQYNLNK